MSQMRGMRKGHAQRLRNSAQPRPQVQLQWGSDQRTTRKMTVNLLPGPGIGLRSRMDLTGP